jgi:small conductance mechanosensitive channel
MDWKRIWETASAELTTFGLKAAGAIAVWLIGRWLIGRAVRLPSAALTRQEVDPTLRRYVAYIVAVALNIALVVAILGCFGVETTTFAALVAAMGIAIGAAWAGLLANFAAGAFLIVLRPFKVGDCVREGRNRRHCEGERNLRHHHHRGGQRFDLRRQQQDLLGHDPELRGRSLSPGRSAGPARPRRGRAGRDSLAEGRARRDAERRKGARAWRGDHRLQRARAGARGPSLRAHDHCWQVCFDTNRAISDTFGAAGYPVPDAHVRMKHAA